MYGHLDLTVKIKRIELLEAVKKNRELHKSQWQQAMAGFREELKKELQEKLRGLEAGESIEMRFENKQPEEHIKEYDDVVEMLEMAADETIELGQAEFKQFVKDDWDWKRQWHTSNNSYIVSAATMESK